MNLGAFAIVAFLRNSMQSEEIKDYAGLIGRSPLVAVALTIDPVQPRRPAAARRLLAEAAGAAVAVRGGRPAADVRAGRRRHQHGDLAGVLPARRQDDVHRSASPTRSRPVDLGFFPTAFVLAMTLPVVMFGIVPELIARWTQQATSGLFR